MNFGKDHLVYRINENAFSGNCCVCGEEFEFGPDYWSVRVTQAGSVTDYGPVCSGYEAEIRHRDRIPDRD